MPFKDHQKDLQYHRQYDKIRRSSLSRREYSKKWRSKNSEKVKVYNREHHEKLRRLAFEKLGNKCSNFACQWVNDNGTKGCTDVLCLQIDHVNNDGAAQRRLGFIERTLYRDVLQDTNNLYQLLCANCNWKKRLLLNNKTL